MTRQAMRSAPMTFDHLIDLSDGRGVYEHALHSVPRPEHGYCLDDVARALVVVVDEPRPNAALVQLTETYLRFVEEAIGADGTAHNRMSADGIWTDGSAMGDWWGRAVGALGRAARRASAVDIRTRAVRAFARASAQSPVEPRTAAFAVLGAVELLEAHHASAAARRILTSCLAVLPDHATEGWAWPESRLRYANATLAEALLAAGHATDDRPLVERALGFLEFLLDLETRDRHLSVTGHEGRGPGEPGPLFDQQGIEVAAMADACARAFRLTRDVRWYQGVRMAWEWFEGSNDVGLAMVDFRSGGGYDGLEAGGRNDNRGAESTIAAIGTYQRARELGIVGTAR